MRLSDAIALGRTLVKPVRGCVFRDKEKTEGCALGMGIKGVGCGSLSEKFPWIMERCERNCPVCGSSHSSMATTMIAHIFDYHVMNPFCESDYTLDQLIDWVRSVEPSEPEEPVSTPVTRVLELMEV